MIVSTTNDTWGALTAVQSVLKEMVFKNLGSELSDKQFHQIEDIYDQISTMVEAN